MRTLWLTSTTTSGRVNRLKPVFSISILYRPGNRLTNEYSPSLPVGCVRFSAVPRLIHANCASTIAAPGGSVTAPAIEPYVDWAKSGGGGKTKYVVKRTTKEIKIKIKTKTDLLFCIRDFLHVRQPDSFAHRPLDRTGTLYRNETTFRT